MSGKRPCNVPKALSVSKDNPTETAKPVSRIRRWLLMFGVVVIIRLIVIGVLIESSIIGGKNTVSNDFVAHQNPLD